MRPNGRLLIKAKRDKTTSNKVMTPIVSTSRDKMIGLAVIGAMSVASPTTPKVLKILEPMILPNAISCSPLRAADKLATSSGKDVPIATMVKPIISSLNP